MQILKYILIGLLVLISIALILIVMMQSKEDNGMSAAMTGGSTNNFYEKNKGRTKEGKQKKWTIILGVAFVIVVVALGWVYPL